MPYKEPTSVGSLFAALFVGFNYHLIPKNKKGASYKLLYGE